MLYIILQPASRSMCETVVFETFNLIIDKKLNMKKIDLIRSIAVKSNLKKEQIAIVVEGVMELLPRRYIRENPSHW